MTGRELRAIRMRLGMSEWQLGRVLAYSGEPHVVRVSIWRLETDRRRIPERVARLAWACGQMGVRVPREWYSRPPPGDVNATAPHPPG